MAKQLKWVRCAPYSTQGKKEQGPGAGHLKYTVSGLAWIHMNIQARCYLNKMSLTLKKCYESYTKDLL